MSADIFMALMQNFQREFGRVQQAELRAVDRETDAVKARTQRLMEPKPMRHPVIEDCE